VLLEDGAVDLETGRKTAWPTGIEVAPSAAFATADGRLVVAATEGTKLVLVTVTKDKLAREPVEASTAGADAGSAGMTPVAVVTDRAHRVVLALRDGRVLLRERGAWTSTQVRSDLPAPRPGAPPARSQSR
ncbi:MAG TPA: hypothetical protein VK427_19225, partial [Kofleriaceae bacterium]|nr:hypothetical protein [Kofleriaceae bacterium]